VSYLSIFEKPIQAKEIVLNPPSEQLHELARKDEISTVLGVPVFHAKVVSRSAKFTEVTKGLYYVLAELSKD
jgi:hypothetical protein